MNLLRESLILRLVAALLALALAATACGTDPALQGDTASQQDPVTPPSTGTTSAPTASAATDNEAAAIPTSATEAVAVPPGPTAALVASGGAVDQGNLIEVSVGTTIATDNDVGAAIMGIGKPGDGNWLITTIGVESMTPIRRTPDADTFVLRSSDGQLIPADAIYNEIGQWRSEVTINGRTLSEVRLAFSTDQLVDNVDGWHLLIGDDDELPIVLPLNGLGFERSYPLTLADVVPSQIDIVDGEIAGCEEAAFDAAVERAVVELGAVTDRSGTFTRVPANQRMVTFDVQFANRAGPTEFDDDCAWIAQWPDFILYVDGRPAQPFQGHPNVRLRGHANLTLPLTFQIPADTATIELVGGSTEAVIGTWELSLPAAVGEPGATLTPAISGQQTSLPTAIGDRPAEVSTSSLSAGGAAGSMFDVEIVIGDSVATNMAPSDLVNGAAADEPDSRTWLVTQIELENTNDELHWAINTWDIVLVDPDGRPRSASFFFDRTGATLDRIGFGGAKEFIEASIAVETNGLVTDANGWALQVSQGNGLPLELPLVGQSTSLSSQFPVPLEAGQTRKITLPRTSCPDDLAVFEFEVERARLGLEGVNTSSTTRDFLFERATEGQRIIVVDLLVTNPVPDSDTLCGLVQDVPHELLNVDGRLIQPFGRTGTFINALETLPMTLTFVIPETAETASLLGGDGEVLASWDLHVS